MAYPVFRSPLFQQRTTVHPVWFIIAGIGAEVKIRRLASP